MPDGPAKIVRCQTWPDGVRECGAPAEAQDERSGNWLCRRHLERRLAPGLQQRRERLALAMAAPLPDLETALAHLRGPAHPVVAGEDGRLPLAGLSLPAEWRPEPGEEPVTTRDGRPFCGACFGQRWLRQEAEAANGWTTQIHPCKECLYTGLIERQNRVATIAGLVEEQRRKTFATFRLSKLSADAMSAAAKWAGHPTGWLVLHGVAGCGKTHLALAAANVLVQREEPFVWWHAGDLAVEAKFLIGQSLHHQLLVDLKRAPVLFIDDLGSARATDWVVADFFEPLLNARYESRAATLLTCIDPATLKREWSESIVRRMEDPSVGRIVRNSAPQWALGEQGN